MTSLYRLFDTDGRLLYIGIAGNPGRRFQQHAAEKEWWGDVGRVALEHFASRDEAAAAEARAIRTERPAYNIMHNSVEPVRVRPAEIMVLCSACGEAIADKAGYIDLDLSYTHHVEKAHRAWNERHPASSWEPVDLKSLMELPRAAPWLAWHRDCDPNPDAYTYWFDVSRFRSTADVLTWTAHLMGKQWVEHTDWGDVLRSLAARLQFSRKPLSTSLVQFEVR